MVHYYDSIPPHLLTWIPKQHLFCVATAPMKADGHINLSPKGLEDTFHVVNPSKVWYEDLTGSGVETISHIRENGRITIMLTAFDGPPNVVRLFGIGTVHEFGSAEYNELIPPETRKPGSRAAIVVDIYQVSAACGYSIPMYKFERNRTKLLEAASKKEERDIKAQEVASLQQADPCSDPSVAGDSTHCVENGLRIYWATKNVTSLDGLPGLPLAAPHSKRKFRPENLFKPSAESESQGINHKKAGLKKRICGEGLLNETRSKIILVGLSSFMVGISVAAAYLQHVSV